MYINLLKFLTINMYLPFVYSSCSNTIVNFEDSVAKQNINIDYNVKNVVLKDKTLNLILSQDTGGTRISLADDVHYGTIESNMKISHGSNIVSAFILMADNGDEIDFEFVGKDQTVVQTNYFYKGIPIYDKNAKFYDTFKDLSETYNNYTIVWTPDYYTWKFNNVTLRTLHKKNTTNFPDSPSKVQIGIWKAQNSKWAGNGVNWSQQPFNISIKSLRLTCGTSNGTNVTNSSNDKNATRTTNLSKSTNATRTTNSSKDKNATRTTNSSNGTNTTRTTNSSNDKNATRTTNSSNDKNATRTTTINTPNTTTNENTNNCATDIRTFINNSNKIYNIFYINMVMGIFYNIF
jgi:beta-glucanase (GH16 family)